MKIKKKKIKECQSKTVCVCARVKTKCVLERELINK